jgi:hypothetical protein
MPPQADHRAWQPYHQNERADRRHAAAVTAGAIVSAAWIAHLPCRLVFAIAVSATL